MSKKLLIVESINDQYFIEAIKNFLNTNSPDISPPICAIDDYECLSGLNLAKLSQKLFDIKQEIDSEDGQEIDANEATTDKIGILLDADNEGIANRIDLINQALQSHFPDVTIENPNCWYHSDSWDVDIACHILNVDGKGELETLLKRISAKKAIFADCLEKWQACIPPDKQLNQKNFDKFWLSVYLRYDGCSKQEIKQAGRKCHFEASMKKNIWDFEHPALTELKTFLCLFNTN